jgi:two-component system LytT family response regulator
MHEDIFINVGRKHLTRINSSDILLIEADGNYSKIITKTSSYLVKDTLSQIEAELPKEIFCRVHRTYIIPISGINDIEGNFIIMDNKKIELARQYRENLLSRLKIFR